MATNIAVKEYTKLEGHKQGVYALLWMSESSVLVSAGGDGSVVKWQLVEEVDGKVADVVGQLYAQLPEPVFCLMRGIADEIWAGTQGGNLFLLSAGAVPRVVKLGNVAIYFIERWMDDRIVVGLGNGELVFLNDAMQVLDRRVLGSKSLRCCLGFGGWVGGSNGIIWKLNAAGDVVDTLGGNEPSVFCMALNAKGELLSGGRDALILNHGSKGGDIERVKAHLYTIHALVGNGRDWVASGSMDKTVKVWDAYSGKLLKVLNRKKFPSTGHSHSVNALCWLTHLAGDGSRRLLASAGDDKTIRIWDLRL